MIEPRDILAGLAAAAVVGIITLIGIQMIGSVPCTTDEQKCRDARNIAYTYIIVADAVGGIPTFLLVKSRL